MLAKWQQYALAILLIAAYTFFAYFLQRHEAEIFITYLFLFATYLFLLKQREKIDLKFFLISAFIIRLVLLFSIPNLSDDFYRFIWDGRLIHAGLHPFSELPSYYIEQAQSVPGLDASLYEKLNSKDYYTIYPPLAQYIFCLSVLISPENILGNFIVLRFLIIAAEFGSIFYMIKLLQHFNQSTNRVLFYALNPLVILELTGNLHFEAFTIFFLILTVYLLVKQKILSSSLAFSMAVSAKLLPLIFLPYLAWQLRWKKGIIFTLIVTLLTLITFIPLQGIEIIQGFQESIGYYFQKFEFNASIYYLVREWGYWYYGYNIIQTVGWKLGVMSALLIILLSVKSRQTTVNSVQLTVDRVLWTKLTFILLIYLLFTTTVHPWYIAPLIAFSVFSQYRFAILWSLLIFFTYAGYNADGFQEIYWITFIEYSAVFTYLIFELRQHAKTTAHHILPQS
ncbi:MAG TPA: glycosyltransferase 87 family protein [Cyclobacteriaceae bacterium]|nr:glycosyltransferase 87 family protein [Cyclobacteriaceae bacterium]